MSRCVGVCAHSLGSLVQNENWIFEMRHFHDLDFNQCLVKCLDSLADYVMITFSHLAELSDNV